MATKIDAHAIASKAARLEGLTGSMRAALMTALEPQIKELETQLNTQHEWLFANVSHDMFEEFQAKWLHDLHCYERAIDAMSTPVQAGLTAA